MATPSTDGIPPLNFVVVTGGSSGIGAKIVQMLEAKNIKVIILDINPPPVKNGTRTPFYKVDLSDADAIASVAERIRSDHGHPTALVNNAGIAHGETILSVTPEKLQRLVSVNLEAPFLLTQQFLPDMIKNNHGHIVNIASLASFLTQAANVDYGATKVGLLAFHEGLKQELRHIYNAPGVRATVIHPTWVNTPMIEPILKAGTLGRYVEPKDVAGAVVRQLTSGNLASNFKRETTVPSSFNLKNATLVEFNAHARDWTKIEKETFEKSEVFNRSATSLCRKGAPLNYTDSDVIIINSQYPNIFPHCTGGGCVASRPFAYITVNLGPVGLALVGNKTDTSGAGCKYNPRCLKRDLTDEILYCYVNKTSFLTLLRDTDDIWWFQTIMSGPWGSRDIGIHPGAHNSLGGDPGRDFWVSPGEPAFWAHHANIDRVWWIWQMRDPEVRAANVSTAVNGPITMYDLYEPHKNATIFDLQNLGWVAEAQEVALGELMSTTEGMFCYIYE
ncbi:tyrosinase central domain protein [Fusarium tjaetaba]|uniref:Tyrosinase central domain protein n=1 Tax=Fusarium tjaetaba TaxID=1567544 RepID=A0A8H5W4U5_9HYPO|nr:tyrosinase central domain protein [Fusarium tjaetaba]KAF5646981.1 tyrosinase central domain protein [Fusarium tjaetaba]